MNGNMEKMDKKSTKPCSIVIKLTQRRYEYLFIQKNNNEKNSFTDKQNHCILGPFPRHMAENDYKQSTTR